MSEVSLVVNGRSVRGSVEDRTLLVHFLRENLGPDGYACRLRHVSMRRLRRPCRRQGRKVVHIACRAGVGIDRGDHRRALRTVQSCIPVQAAFKEHHGLQCGFCTPGMIMAATDMIRRHPGGLG